MKKLLRDFDASKESNASQVGWHERRIGPYILTEQVLGMGTSSTVKLAHNVLTNSRSAVKVVTKTVSRKKKDARKEIHILSQISEPHENIIRLQHVEEDHQNIYIFTQLYDQGDLFSYISKHGTFDEPSAMRIFRQMVEAVLYCHQRLHICHHDVKLENFVLDRTNKVALIDFGFSVELGPSKKITVFDSSPIYSPLEILLKRPHDSSVDTYSLGVCLFYMIFGNYPFNGTTFEDLCLNVQQSNVTFPSNSNSSSHLRDLLLKMLAHHQHRISLADVLSHNWLSNGIAPSSYRDRLSSDDDS